VKSSRTNIYSVDSSALITINRYYPRNIFPDLWVNIDDLFKRGRVFSHEMVYNEIVPTTGPKDNLAKLLSKYKSSFYPISNRQGQIALQILAAFPRLIDPQAKKDQADPWVIALVVEKMEEEDLFGDDSEYVVVSAESEKSSTKIPAVCKHFNVRHLNLFEFFEDNDWRFSVSSNSP